jgi:hypothetical protein
MASGHRLLILSCSKRKCPSLGLLPAIERYDGMAFRVLRRFLREQPDRAKQLEVFILSAAYGLIGAEYSIPDYDQVMTPQRATELREEVIGTFADLLSNNNYGSVCLAMSKLYLATLEDWPAFMPADTVVTVTDGPQGVKLAQLKRWVWGDLLDDPKRKHRETRSRGIARLRGVELKMTPAQVLERARTALAEDETGAEGFRDWFVEVDGRRVAPKWLVTVLTGLPVSAFTTGEARRVLHCLGIQLLKASEVDR